MIRFRFALSFGLLGSLIASTAAIGQESKDETPIKGQAHEVAEASAEHLVGVTNFILKDGELDDADDEQVKVQDAVKAIAPKSVARPRTYSFTTPVTVAKVHDALEANFGLSLSEADDALRSQLEIPPDQGVVVVGVKSGSLADRKGLKANDVLLKLGEQKAAEVSQVRKILLELGKETLEVRLLREGKSTQLELAGPADGVPSESTEFWLGVPVTPVDATLRAHLSNLPADSGLIVNDVVKGSPAEQVSIRKNDILISMDGKPLKVSQDLIAQIQASKGKPVPLQILRTGKPLTITVTPAKRLDFSVVNFHSLNLDGQSKSALKYRVVRPNMAIEVEPRTALNQPTEVKGLFKQPEAKQQPIKVTPFARVNKVEKITGSVIATNPNQGQSVAGTTSFQFQMPENGAGRELVSGRIEAQLKEITAKLEELTKALEGLKKPTEK